MAVRPTPEETTNHGLSQGGDTAGALRPLEEDKEEEDSGMALEEDPARGEEGLEEEEEEEGEEVKVRKAPKGPTKRERERGTRGDAHTVPRLVQPLCQRQGPKPASQERRRR